jgi:C1A family cysteine protease
LALAAAYYFYNKNKQSHSTDFEINDTAVYDAWTHYKSRYNKSYQHDVEWYRFSNFKANLIKMGEYNDKLEAGEITYTVGMNEFADMDQKEFKEKMLGTKVQTTKTNVKTLTNTVAASVDWTTKGAVTPVKNQGQCGSCWAFSTTGSLEGAAFNKNGKLQSFSEQQLVDCSGDFGNEGCNGGLMDSAFSYVEKNGITLESSYKYTAADGTCSYKTSDSVFKNSAHTDVPASDPAQLAAAVNLGPVSIAIEADQFGFQFYSGGVFSGACGTSLDHGVLLVGYGTDAGKDFWKVKNSWGGSWGEQGYIRFIKTDAAGPGQCGLQLQASYPTA